MNKRKYSAHTQSSFSQDLLSELIGKKQQIECITLQATMGESVGWLRKKIGLKTNFAVKMTLKHLQNKKE